MKFLPTISILLTLLIASPAHAKRNTSKAKTAQWKSHTKAKSRTRSKAKHRAAKLRKIPARIKLGSRYKQITLNDKPADQLFKELCDVLNINLKINWQQLEKLGYPKDTPVTLKLKNVTVHDLITLALEAVTPKDQSPLLMQYHKNTLQILTKEQANRKLVIHTYDIKAQTMVIRNFKPPTLGFSSNSGNRNQSNNNQYNRRNNNQRNNNNNGDSQYSLFGVTKGKNSKDEKRISSTDKGKGIAQLIRDTIEPEIWKGNGGERAYIKFYRGKLYIKAPEYVHNQIDIK